MNAYDKIVIENKKNRKYD